jgi:hypothetical protein
MSLPCPRGYGGVASRVAIPTALQVKMKHRRLMKAVRQERFEDAARLRDELLGMMFRRFCDHVEVMCNMLGVGLPKVDADPTSIPFTTRSRYV